MKTKRGQGGSMSDLDMALFKKDGVNSGLEEKDHLHIMEHSAARGKNSRYSLYRGDDRSHPLCHDCCANDIRMYLAGVYYAINHLKARLGE